MVCEFFDNITPYQRAVDLKAIIQKYDSYNGISAQQLSLAGQFVKKIKKHESFFTFRETTKARYIANMDDIARQMEIIRNDTLIIDGAYNDYENYLDNSGDSGYIVDKSKFFDLMRNNCDLAVQVTADDDEDDGVVTTVVGKNDGKHQGLPVATFVNSTALGLLKSIKRKSRRRKSRKSRK
jgi:hypothetical protein